MDYKKLNKKALTCMYVKTLINSVIMIAILLGANVLWSDEWPAFVSNIIYVVVGLRIIHTLFTPKIRYERYRYILTEEEFEVREGLILVTTEIVPIERLHKIEVSSGPIFRAFGLKSVKATTAGGEIEVSYLENEVADRIANHLKHRINAIAIEERNAESDENMQSNIAVQNDTVQQSILNHTYMEDCDGTE